MGKLKWIAAPSTYRFAVCEFGRYQIIGRGGQRLRVTDPVGVVLIHPEHRSVADAKGWAEADYTRRIAKIAAANGYVKLADDEMVVKLRSAHDPERARRKDMCHIEIDALAKSAGYIKLEPGQVVVDEVDIAEILDARRFGHDSPSTGPVALKLRMLISSWMRDEEARVTKAPRTHR